MLTPHPRGLLCCLAATACSANDAIICPSRRVMAESSALRHVCARDAAVDQRSPCASIAIVLSTGGERPRGDDRQRGALQPLGCGW